MNLLPLASAAAWGGLVVAAYRQGRGPFAAFVGTIFGIHTVVSSTLSAYVPAALMPAFAYAQGTVYVHAFSLARGGMPSLAWRAGVSWPASWFTAGTFLALPWALASVVARPTATMWVPYALAAVGFAQSFALRTNDVHVTLGARVEGLRRVAPSSPEARPALRIAQISDPHLGSFMSVDRLRAVCERAVASAPDLVALTGDYLTVESHAHGDDLARALEPLRAMQGRVVACFGNHDHEAPEAITRALRAVGAILLIDEMATVDTPVGPVEVLGYDFRWRDRRAHLTAVSARFPRREGVPRVALLHDPGAFALLPDGAADLVLAGHTHGGQVGLHSLGLPHTAVSMLSSVPDHGLWGLGAMRLYVHRGTGHYGFPVRLGVTPEEVVLHARFA